MRFMLLMYATWSGSTGERAAVMAESTGICDELAALGTLVDASLLEPESTAETVRLRDGRPLVTGGPIAGTTEQLGGYVVLDVADLDEAISVAARLPSARNGAIEIRPIAVLEGLPPARQLPAGQRAAAGTPFLLLCYDDESAWLEAGPAALAAARAEAAGLARELGDAGRFLSASPLQPAATATCVRVRDGKRVITDGPFAETHEMLGGYYRILAESRADALRVAARHPGVRFGAVEVRPLFDLVV